MASWNPWHGCHKISEGCRHCYVYRMDEKYDRDSSKVKKTSSFDLPIKRGRDKEYKIKNDVVYTCFTSDFFVEDADDWRPQAWEMMKTRSDLHFLFITKRIHRFYDCIPSDWGKGYPNVSICCTTENQKMAEERLPIFLQAPIVYKHIICEPLLSKMDISKYLDESILSVIAGGESGLKARLCDYSWILSLREQCINADVAFIFRQTGARLKKDGKLYAIKRKYQHSQARRANIDFKPDTKITDAQFVRPLYIEEK